MNVIRSMMTSRNVPKSFWTEATKWEAYVINKSPTLSVKNMTPKEELSGLKPLMHHFKVFGCITFVHIPDVHRKNLDVNSTK